MEELAVIEQRSELVVVAPAAAEFVVDESPELRLVEIIERGPKGEKGDPGHETILVAATILSGHRAITTDENGQAIYADKDSSRRPLGISSNAAVQDAEIRVRTFGEMAEPTWAWILDQPIYLGVNGALTQEPPATGFLIELAWPLTPTSIFVSVGQTFLRS